MIAGLSVLILDDHMVVEQTLEGSDAEILLAASATRALDICKRQIVICSICVGAQQTFTDYIA